MWRTPQVNQGTPSYYLPASTLFLWGQRRLDVALLVIITQIKNQETIKFYPHRFQDMLVLTPGVQIVTPGMIQHWVNV